MKNNKLLFPDLAANEILNYHITKSLRYGIGNEIEEKWNYKIEIKQIQKGLLEIHFPNSILSTLKCFSKIRDQIFEVKNARNKTLYISVDEEFNLNLKNKIELQENLKLIKRGIDQMDLDLDSKMELKDELVYLVRNSERIQNHFLKDLIPIFEEYGGKIEDDVYIDISSEMNEFENENSKLIKKRNLDLITYDILEENKYRIEVLHAKDIIFGNSKKDWQKIKQEFLMKNKIIEEEDISLFHKRYIFNINTMFLEEFNSVRKLISPNLKKMEEVKIILE